jgi:selenocysteine lyase/cysteine desulfurase
MVQLSSRAAPYLVQKQEWPRVPLELYAPPGGEPEINLDYAATTPSLRVALEAVVEFLPWYGSVHRGGGARSERSTTAYEGAREAVARFVAAPADRSVVFVRNTTEAANLLAATLRPGSRILCSPFEHHANLLPWRSHDVTYLPFTRSADELLAAVRAELRTAADAQRPFELFAVSGASNVTGEIPPLAELARSAHQVGTRIFVDAAQLAPHRPIDVGAIDADFLAFSGHKLYAPFGTGALIARTSALSDRPPLLHGGGAVRLVSLDDLALSDVPHRFEAGTPNSVGAVALGAACDALASFGMDRLATEEKRLSDRLWCGLEAVAGVHLLRMWEHVDDRVGVAAFSLDGYEHHELARALAERGIAVRSGAFCAHPLVAHLLGVPVGETKRSFERLALGDEVTVPGAVRASLGIGVTEADVDALHAALEQLAAARR